MNEGQIYILSDSIAVCTMPDGSTKQITIQRPNDPNTPYRIIRRILKISSDYRDPLYRPKSGARKFELEFQLSYKSHRMDLTPLLVAESISLKVPTYIYKDDRYYSTFEVKLLNDQFIEEPIDGLKVAHLSSEFKKSNPVPNSSEILRFQTNPYTFSEFLTVLDWFQPNTVLDDDSEPIPGFAIVSDTDDELGFSVKAYEPAEFQDELNTTIKVGNKYFMIESILMESNEV